MMDEDDVKEEWGSITPIRFLPPECTSLRDSDGNVIENPKCKICGLYKCMVIGKECFSWVCMMGCKDG
jgi:hypothetical protein